MGFFSKIKGEFIDIIEWTDSSNDTMVHRFERYDNEIKYGAKLIVRESQIAVFVNMGEIADIFEPGSYLLETENIPVLTTLKHWSHGFSSPFKAEVYFINTKRFVDLRWGTKNPIMLRDKEFGPVRIRAFGTYAIKVAEPKTFLTEIVGTDNHFTTDEISDQLRNLIVSRFATITAAANIAVLDMAMNYEQLGGFLEEKISPEFGNYGLSITKLLIENISLPSNVEEALDKRTSRGLTGNLDDHLKYQAAESFSQEGGSATGDAMGMGMGIAMAQQMASGMMPNANQASSGAATPPPVPQGITYHFALNGASAGPYDLATIKTMIGEAKITPQTLAWKDGMPAWEAASTISDLKTLFKATPPPLPPM